jgi:hypothetical protein
MFLYKAITRLDKNFYPKASPNINLPFLKERI